MNDMMIDPFDLGELAKAMRTHSIARLTTGGTTIVLGPMPVAPTAERTVEAERQDRAEQDEAMLFASSEGFPR